jgi:hypothetical protein
MIYNGDLMRIAINYSQGSILNYLLQYGANKHYNDDEFLLLAVEQKNLSIINDLVDENTNPKVFGVAIEMAKNDRLVVDELYRLKNKYDI